MPDFIPGLELCGLYYEEAVRPILTEFDPELVYSAALIGPGSDVLGFDTSMSSDHYWGPRLLLFLAEDETRQDAIQHSLGEKLPVSFRGFSTHYGPPDDKGVRLAQPVETGPVDPLIQLTTVADFFDFYLGIDPRQPLHPRDWLTLPEQKLLSVTGGRVYHDGLGELTLVRERLSYYPKDVWLYLMAAQWARISEEEAFVGRAGGVGDELGSRVIAARLVQGMMKLCFLLERQYAPYSKWFGTAFARLECAPVMLRLFHLILDAVEWQEREQYLCDAYETLAEKHNHLRVTPPLPTQVRPYYNRPFLTLGADRFSEALRAMIREPEVRGWPGIGAIDQISDNVDVLGDPDLAHKLHGLYDDK